MLHRVDDIFAMPGQRFFPLAMRLAAYQGVIAARVSAENENTRSSRPAGRADPGSADRVVEPTRAAILADPVLAGVVSFGGDR